MAQDTREWEQEFEDRFSAFTFNNGGALELTLWDVVDERIHPINEVGVEIYNFLHHQLQKAREDVYKEVQANAEQCYRDNGRGAFEPVKATPLYKIFTN